MARHAFNSVVAARTRAAIQIIETPDLLNKYEELGGLRRDLEAIRDAGLEAEAANLSQSQAKSTGKGATIDVLAGFASMQKEYSSVMAILQVVYADLVRTGAPAGLIAKMEGIIRNEAQVTVSAYEEGGEKKRKVGKSKSQEALRAEIAKDAGALLGLTGIHPALAERRVTTARLDALLASAGDLAGMLGSRTAAKGAAKTSTKLEKDAVSRQRDVWGASYRLLSALGKRDDRVRSLLAQAAR